MKISQKWTHMFDVCILPKFKRSLEEETGEKVQQGYVLRFTFIQGKINRITNMLLSVILIFSNALFVVPTFNLVFFVATKYLIFQFFYCHEEFAYVFVSHQIHYTFIQSQL